jgi:glycine cleavage system H protein
VESNKALPEQPATVNSDPLGAGWFFKLRLADKGQIDKLMDEAAYKSFCEGEH